MKGKGSGWKGESRRHSLARKGVSTVIDQDRRFDVSNFVARGLLTKIMDIIDKYEKKDYWGDEELIKMKIAEWEQFGKPEPHTPQSIRDELNDIMSEDRLDWVTKMVNHIEKKDKTYLQNVLRYDQPFTLEIFTAVTGIETKGKSNKKLNKIIDVYTGDFKASGKSWATGDPAFSDDFIAMQEQSADKQRSNIEKARRGQIKGRKTYTVGEDTHKAQNPSHEAYLGLLKAYDGIGNMAGEENKVASIRYFDYKDAHVREDYYKIDKKGKYKYIETIDLGATT